MPRTYAEVYQFKIELKGINPTVWRRIQVPANYSFWDLHIAIQDAMGWQDQHLHAFRIMNPSRGETDSIGVPDESGFMVFLPGWELAIADYFSDNNRRAAYEYDFGDSWDHEIVLEDILPRKRGTKYPRCLAGERACPPEDCGGIPGYQDLLKILTDPTHEEFENTRKWVGSSYDPEKFDPDAVKFGNPKQRWERAFEEA